jgi:hypothetical protein
MTPSSSTSAAPTAPPARCIDNATLLADLERVVGSRYVLTSEASTHQFCKGFRFGDGPAFGRCTSRYFVGNIFRQQAQPLLVAPLIQ